VWQATPSTGEWGKARMIWHEHLDFLGTTGNLRNLSRRTEEEKGKGQGEAKGDLRKAGGGPVEKKTADQRGEGEKN